jgi:hypothetical protein
LFLLDSGGSWLLLERLLFLGLLASCLADLVVGMDVALVGSMAPAAALCMELTGGIGGIFTGGKMTCTM